MKVKRYDRRIKRMRVVHALVLHVQRNFPNPDFGTFSREDVARAFGVPVHMLGDKRDSHNR